MKQPYCITFAGPVGSSKTPISHVLSTTFGLPVFNNDAIRTEVIEDVGQLDQEIYLARRNERLQDIVSRGVSFIYDASIDRQWQDLYTLLVQHGYTYYVISLDPSKKLLTKLYQAKEYQESLLQIDRWIRDHDTFLSTFGAEIGLHLTDVDFPDRCNKSIEVVRAWLETQKNHQE